MSTPFGPEAAASGAQPTPSITIPAARIHLREEAPVAYLSISPPLDSATLAELTHTLETWQMPAHLKAFVLEMTNCAGSSSPASAEGAAKKRLEETRQGRVRERALVVAQERAQAALSRIPVPVLGVASGSVPPLCCVLLSCCDVLLAAQETVFVCEGNSFLAYRAPITRAGGTGALLERISAHQAHRQGLINWLAPADQLSHEMERILGMLRELSATSLALAKQAFLIGIAHPNAPEKALAEIGSLYLQDLMA
ncbi:MAG TPA: enoyl-CoA hydratase-related protein, partial [Ktedonobacterales bacterium]|nr:enoyl-CoA hydratase-related protein [Ktedonobacterales bacterium]